MAITTEEARELVEAVFDFDHVGSEMLAVRKNFDSTEAQEALVEELVRAVAEELKDTSEENLAVITMTAKARVGEFVKGAKFSQSGCSGL
jgi:uncharacterized protein (DUF3084 family)